MYDENPVDSDAKNRNCVGDDQRNATGTSNIKKNRLRDLRFHDEKTTWRKFPFKAELKEGGGKDDQRERSWTISRRTRVQVRSRRCFVVGGTEGVGVPSKRLRDCREVICNDDDDSPSYR